MQKFLQKISSKLTAVKFLLLAVGVMCSQGVWGYEVPDGYQISDVILGTANYSGGTITSVTADDFSSVENITGWTADDGVTVSLGNISEAALAAVNGTTYVSGNCIQFDRAKKTTDPLGAVYNFSPISSDILVFNCDILNYGGQNTSHPNEIRFIDSDGNVVLRMAYSNGSGAKAFEVYDSQGNKLKYGCDSNYRTYCGYGIRDLVINLSSGACSMSINYTNSNGSNQTTNWTFNIGTGKNIAGLKINRYNNNNYDDKYHFYTYLDNVSLYHVTSEVTYYTASFINSNSGNNVTSTTTIYSDSNRTTPATNGELEDGSTYYFTTTEHGYQTYQGSFAVDGANPNVTFAMTAKSVYNYTVKAVDGSEPNNILSQLSSGSVYEGETVNFAYPRFVLYGTTLYSCGSGTKTYSTTFTPDADNYIHNITYNDETIANVVYYTEGEDVVGVSSAANAARASVGKMGYTATSTTYADVTTIQPGVYKLYLRGQNGNSSSRTFNFKVGETVVFTGSIPNGTNVDQNSDVFTVSSASTLAYACEGSTLSGVDYFYLVKTGEVEVSASIGQYGYATFSSTYALDFTNVTDATAYIATSKNGDNVTMQAVTGTVAAGTGLVLKSTNGGAATVSIPVAESGTSYNTTTDPKNYLFAIDSDYNLNKSNTGTNYVLSVQNGNVVFAPIGDVAAPVTAGHAGLWIPAADAQVRALNMTFSDEVVTGISAVEATKMLQNETIYNLSGQRVEKPTKGIYIIGGKKVYVK